MGLNLNIVSLKNYIFFKDIKSVKVPGLKGYLSIYINHTPLLTFLKSGLINIIKNNNFKKNIYISKGILEIKYNIINIIADFFIDIKKLDKKMLMNKKTYLKKKCNRIYDVNKLKKINKKYKDVISKIQFINKLKKNKKYNF
ncbi:MAG: ATP synthase F1 subunit epsilon [Buchnera aphidicola (Periphyllus lyropictus)]|uniref:ATP synthase F1 subunit epsilon n=1 Tax=Buchnera aphidicola TaxID=9 RepID=UPI001EBC2D4F|nr:ATP synthase F1 subunit epsilon [Buchnera aphidicola]NIH16796.1 ATP synthase F1 subunit epsilon [Buchnera aphidicola (Periphyllus lyropictus)]USS94692.1 ATP synthase F1 subunit epsilon [Buchnera aphidicola (Periphyllus lyropictus)]